MMEDVQNLYVTVFGEFLEIAQSLLLRLSLFLFFGQRVATERGRCVVYMLGYWLKATTTALFALEYS
jgi:hypothetical protein